MPESIEQPTTSVLTGTSAMTDAHRLQGLVNLHFDYASWLLYYCRQILLGAPDFSLNGMSVSRSELELLGLDSEELLSQLIAGDVGSPWVQGAKSLDYLDDGGRERSATPLSDIMAMQLVRIHLKANITAFPYPQLLNTLRSLCQKLEFRHKDFLIPHYGCPCEDPLRLAQSLLNRECEPLQVARELDIWRLRATERLHIACEPFRLAEEQIRLPVEPLTEKGLLPLFLPQNIHSLRTDDQRIQCTVRRLVMARLTGRTPDAIRNWDQRGVSVADIPWPKLKRSVTGRPEYFLPDYLEALQQVIPRFRDRSRDRQLREEIIGQKYVD